MKRMPKHRFTGFTLIELFIAILIIPIATGALMIMINGMNQARVRAFDRLNMRKDAARTLFHWRQDIRPGRLDRNLAHGS
jgi:type II secretory pathway pseudopilin PulG